MARATQLSVALPNKPGQLAKLTSTLAKAGVNIEALSVVDSTETGSVRLIVSPLGAAKKAIKKLNATVSQQSVLVLKMTNEPGALGAVAKKLAAAKVNVNYVYGSTSRSGEDATLVFGVDDVDAAEKAV